MITPFTATSCFTMQCADTQTGVSVTRCFTASSIISQSDADKRAEAAAQQTAYAALQCEFPPPPGAVVFFNLPLTGARNCFTCAESGLGSPVPVLIPVSVPAASFFSYVSQESADGAAQYLLDSLESNESCAPAYSSTEQSYTAQCPVGSTGSRTDTASSGYACSLISVAEANVRALAYATATAIANLSCSVATYANEAVSVTLTCAGGLKGPSVTASVSPGLYFSSTSQAAANALATAAAQTAATAQLTCFTYGNVTKTSHGGADPQPDCSNVDVFGPGFSGAAGTAVTVPADTYFSNDTQEAADDAAEAAANAEYNSSLNCQYLE